MVDTRLHGDVRERIVDIGDRVRRLNYSIVGGRPTHHIASIQVVDDGGGRSRIVWITELLPDTLAELFGGLMDQGCASMKETLEPA